MTCVGGRVISFTDVESKILTASLNSPHPSSFDITENITSLCYDITAIWRQYTYKYNVTYIYRMINTSAWRFVRMRVDILGSYPRNIQHDARMVLNVGLFVIALRWARWCWQTARTSSATVGQSTARKVTASLQLGVHTDHAANRILTGSLQRRSEY